MANTNSVVNYPGVQEVAGMVISPNGGQVVFVGTSANVASLGETGEAIASRAYPTVNAALTVCQSGRGDFVYLLPGYTETVSAADAWSNLGTKTGVTVVGLGRGTNRPTFTYSAAAATILMDVANFRIQNCIFYMAGDTGSSTALTVAAPITVSAAGCAIEDCFIHWGVDADQIVTIGITTTAAADNFSFNRNFCFGATLAVPTTTFLRLTGTDYLEIDGTMIIGPGSTTAIGPVQQLTTAGLGSKISNSVFQSTLAASTVSFTAIAGCTGIVDKCAFGVLAAGNGLTTGSGLQVTNSKTAVAGAAGADTTG